MKVSNLMLRNTVFRLTSLLLLTTAATTPSWAASFDKDPDWPCQQRLVPHVAAATYWAGEAPVPSAEDAPQDKARAAVIAAVSDRSLPLADGQARLAAYADTIPQAERSKVLGTLFADITAAIDTERTSLISRIKELGRHQRGIARQVEAVNGDLSKLPEEPQGADLVKSNDLNSERGLLVRSYQETQHTMRYVCEAPADLEGRLAAYARTLQAKIQSAH
ncbi:putative secreted protein [Granulibacter bethesdensis CGDNIH4]|nr:putative secreted protein [Granulibacter bethesdensis CGDNIH4]